MQLPTLLRKELAWSRHRIGILVVLLIVLPAAFGAGTFFFQHTFPENTPVAVVGTDGATDDDVGLVVSTINISEFSDPVVYESRDRAFDDLEREQVYAVIEVPGGLGNTGTESTIDLHVDGRMTPYRVPSTALVAILSTIDEQFGLPGNVEAERHVIGAETDLPTYLFPVFMMIFLLFLAFTYVPYNVAREQRAIDRLRLASSVDAMLATKFALFVPSVLVATVDHDVDPLASERLRRRLAESA